MSAWKKLCEGPSTTVNFK